MGPLISIRKQFRTTSAFSALTLNTIAPCPVSP
jgi:hypothetical protein